MATLREQPVELVGQVLEIDDTESVHTGQDHGPTSALPTSQVMESRNRHGRRYHAFDEDSYWLPNDDTEIKRLGIQHYAWRLTLDGKLYISPIPNDVQRVVDIGTGAGQWAIEFADSHPAAEVIGTDLSPIQPAWKPKNCTFQIANAETEWRFNRKFDFVHSRMIVLGIHDWAKYFKQAWDNLKPGGWAEVQEVLYPISSADDGDQSGSPLWRFSDYATKSAAKTGIDLSIAPRLKDLMEEQGFVNVRLESVKWPVGTWPKGQKEKTIGYWTRENVKQFISPVARALFTKYLGWSEEEVETHEGEVMKDIEDPKKHFYWQMLVHQSHRSILILTIVSRFFCSAQKPESAR